MRGVRVTPVGTMRQKLYLLFDCKVADNVSGGELRPIPQKYVNSIG